MENCIQYFSIFKILQLSFLLRAMYTPITTLPFLSCIFYVDWISSSITQGLSQTNHVLSFTRCLIVLLFSRCFFNLLGEIDYYQIISIVATTIVEIYSKVIWHLFTLCSLSLNYLYLFNFISINFLLGNYLVLFLIYFICYLFVILFLFYKLIKMIATMLYLSIITKTTYTNLQPVIGSQRSHLIPLLKTLCTNISNLNINALAFISPTSSILHASASFLCHQTAVL